MSDHRSTDRYVGLFSGGKDSYLAIKLALSYGIEITRLLTVEAHHGSYLYQSQGVSAAGTIAAATGFEHTYLPLESSGVHGSSDTAATHELRPLRMWLEQTTQNSSEAIDGLVAGVVASEYQRDRLQDLCDQFDLDLFTPLWGRSGTDILSLVTQHGLTVLIVGVAAEGLGPDWLGRSLDVSAIRELRELAAETGMHPAGEGGEYETLVVDGPEFASPVQVIGTPQWKGTFGYLCIDEIICESTDRPNQ